jgi:hypothetical protein
MLERCTVTSPLRSALLLATLACAPLPACGGSSSAFTSGDDGGGGEGGGGVSAEQAANDVASAYCARAEACAPAYLTYEFGDASTCKTRFAAALATEFGANGTSLTTALAEGCAQAIPNETCSDLLGRNTPQACQAVPGMLADGSPCASDWQCHGARCKVAPNAVCGTCGSLAAAGAACGVDDDCQLGMKCLNAACVAYGGSNASCDAKHPCRGDLGCKGGVCTTPSQAGTACASSDECDNAHGIFCNPVTMKCEQVSFAAPNAACGLVNSQLVLCTGPGPYCAGATQATMYKGSCLPYAQDDAACDPDAGPLCNVESACVGGTCTMSDPGKCH